MGVKIIMGCRWSTLKSLKLNVCSSRPKTEVFPKLGTVIKKTTTLGQKIKI